MAGYVYVLMLGGAGLGDRRPWQCAGRLVMVGWEFGARGGVVAVILGVGVWFWGDKGSGWQARTARSCVYYIVYWVGRIGTLGIPRQLLLSRPETGIGRAVAEDRGPGRESLREFPGLG